jgi:hypothetical protein
MELSCSTVTCAAAARQTHGSQAPRHGVAPIERLGGRPFPDGPPAYARAAHGKSTRGGRGSLLVVIGVALGGCVHTSHTVSPYRDDARAAQELVDRARSPCLERTSQLPPRAFATDGCSAFADDGWVECCVAHDAVYWCGGTAEERRQADRRLEQCVADLGHPRLARLMYLGVRAGGASWIPLPWRWGFGWDFPYDGDPRSGTSTRRSAAGTSAAEPPQ